MEVGSVVKVSAVPRYGSPTRRGSEKEEERNDFRGGHPGQQGSDHAGLKGSQAAVG